MTGITTNLIDSVGGSTGYPATLRRTNNLVARKLCCAPTVLRSETPTYWRTFDLAQQESQAGRCPIHSRVSRWGRAPPLHSQCVDCEWARGSDGKQYRDTRVALPPWHCQRAALQRSVDLRPIGALSIAQRCRQAARCSDGDSGQLDAGAFILRQRSDRHGCPAVRSRRRFSIDLRQT